MPVTASTVQPRTLPGNTSSEAPSPDISAMPGGLRPTDSQESIGSGTAGALERGESPNVAVTREELRDLEAAVRMWSGVRENMDLDGLAPIVTRMWKYPKIEDVPTSLIRSALDRVLVGMDEGVRTELLNKWEGATKTGGRWAAVPSQLAQFVTYAAPLTLIPVTNEKAAAYATLGFRLVWINFSTFLQAFTRSRFTTGQEVLRLQAGMDIKVSKDDIPEEPQRSVVRKETKELLQRLNVTMRDFEAKRVQHGIDAGVLESSTPEELEGFFRRLDPQVVFEFEQLLEQLVGFASSDGEQSVPKQVQAYQTVYDRDGRHSARENPIVLQTVRIAKPLLESLGNLLHEQVEGQPWPLEHGLSGWAPSTLSALSYLPIFGGSILGAGQGEGRKRYVMPGENFRHADSILASQAAIESRNKIAAHMSEESATGEWFSRDGLMAMFNVPALNTQAEAVAFFDQMRQTLQAEYEVVKDAPDLNAQIEANTKYKQIEVCELKIDRLRNGQFEPTVEEERELTNLNETIDGFIEAKNKLDKPIAPQAILGKSGLYTDMRGGKKGELGFQAAQTFGAASAVVVGGTEGQGLVQSVYSAIKGGAEHTDRRVVLGLTGLTTSFTVLTTLFQGTLNIVNKEEARREAKQRKDAAVERGEDPEEVKLGDIYFRQFMKTATGAVPEIFTVFKDNAVANDAIKSGAKLAEVHSVAVAIRPAVEAVASELRARGHRHAAAAARSETGEVTTAAHSDNAEVERIMSDLASGVTDEALGLPPGENIPLRELSEAGPSGTR